MKTHWDLDDEDDALDKVLGILLALLVVAVCAFALGALYELARGFV